MMNNEEASSAPSAVPPKDKPKRFTLTKWDAVALRKWTGVAGTVCLICKQIMAKACNTCQETGQVNCRVVHGVCNHVYHEHCILNWLEKSTDQPTCPHTTSESQTHEWQVSKYGL